MGLTPQFPLFGIRVWPVEIFATVPTGVLPVLRTVITVRRRFHNDLPVVVFRLLNEIHSVSLRSITECCAALIACQHVSGDVEFVHAHSSIFPC